MGETVIEPVPTKLEPGIRGWLWLPAVALLVQPFAFIHNNLSVMFQARSIGGSITVDYSVLAVDLVLLLFTAVVTYLFFGRKALAPAAYVSSVVCTFLLWMIRDTFASEFKAPLIGIAVGWIVLIPYFVFSKRVRITFAEPLDANCWPDRLLFLSAPAFQKVYKWLARLKRVWLLEIAMIALLMAGFVLQASVRAVFVLKDPALFRQLLFG
jgi:Protein of unknown function (DUF2569)